VADRYNATIWFPAVALQDGEIKEVLEEEGLEFDPLKSNDMDIDIGIDEGIFWMQSQETSWGQFQELEALLRAKCIPFDRDSGAKYEYIPERVIFRPAGSGKPAQDLTFLLLGEGGEPAVKLSEISNLLPQGIEAIRAFLDREFPAYPPLSDYLKEGRAMALTKDRIKQYLDSPWTCLWCGAVGQDLTPSGIEGFEAEDLEAAELMARITCGKCGKTWRNYYILHDVEEEDADGCAIPNEGG
jgi:hypothetical protein